jgi:excisionase family DNA binding protein
VVGPLGAVDEPVGQTEDRQADDDGAAERLSVSLRTIRRFITDGMLPGYRVGGPRGRLLRVELTDVDALLRRIPTVESWQAK